MGIDIEQGKTDKKKERIQIHIDRIAGSCVWRPHGDADSRER